MNFFAGMNWLAIVVSAFVYFIIGAIWYSNVLFAKEWVKQSGVTMGGGKSMPVMPMIGQFIGSLIYTIGIAATIKLMNGSGALTGLATGLFVTVLFALPINLSTWFFKSKPVLFFIEWGYQGIGAVIIGIILGIWK